MRLQLFVLGGRDVGRSFEVSSGDVLGRAVECEVRLGDRSISRRHARAVLRDGTWTVEDLGSRNGLLVHGRRVRETELSDHLEFRLGELPFRVRLGEDRAQPEEEEIHLESEPSERAEPTVPEPVPATPMESERDRRRGEILRDGALARRWSGDLSQRPPWIRAVIFVVVVALAAGVFLLAFESVQLLRGAP